MINAIIEGYLPNTSDSYERLQKEKEYINYINNHKLKVREIYLNKFVPLLDKSLTLETISEDEFKQGIRDAESNINTHDDSKFGEEEFDQYRMRYYPTVEEKKWLEANYGENLDKFVEEAVDHHYKINPHHPKYWVEENGNIRDMSINYIIEMLCDWISSGDDTRVWYQNSASKEKSWMSTRTKQIVEELLDILQ